MLLLEMDLLDKVAARITGPMSFRFILQPLAALIIGFKAGRLDAKAGTPPFVMDIIFKPEDRKAAIGKAFHSLLTSFVIAVIIDAIVQYLIFHHINPLGALLIGFLMITIPYTLARGITNRTVSHRLKKKGSDQT